MASFKEIDRARKLLGLWDYASLQDIKRAYRKKAFQYHPDKCSHDNNQSEEKMKSLNQSYQLLVEYCSRYKYSFEEEDIDRHGAEIYSLERLLAVRDGISSQDDTLPHRIMKEALKGGRSDGVRISEENFQKMLQEYYQLRGWNEDGIPAESV